LVALMRPHLAQPAPRGRVDSLAVVNRHSLQPLDAVHDDGLVALAVFFDKARLIDNLELIRS